MEERRKLYIMVFMKILPAFLFLSAFLPLSFGAAEEPLEIRMGLKEIIGESSALKAKLGLVRQNAESQTLRNIKDIFLFDLSMAGLVEILDITTPEAENFNEPRLELKLTEGPKEMLLHGKIMAGKNALGSFNLKEPPSEIRRLAHRLSQETLRTLTGEKGFFLSKIAFALKYKGRKEVWIADWDGKNAQPVTQWAGVSMLPSWSTDGRFIVFTSYKNGNPDLFRYELRTKAFETLSSHQGLNSSAAFDPQGKGMAITLSRGKDPNIYFLSPQGKILHALTRTFGVDTSPVFSPNGEEIAFTTDRSGNPQIFIMSRSGNNARRLTYGLFWADGADWSKNGTMIALSGKHKREEKFQIFVTDPLGLKIFKLTTEEANEYPSFSPDGRLLAFTSKRNGKWEIFIKGLSELTPDIKILAFDKAQAVEPAWSPLLD